MRFVTVVILNVRVTNKRVKANSSTIAQKREILKFFYKCDVREQFSFGKVSGRRSKEEAVSC